MRDETHKAGKSTRGTALVRREVKKSRYRTWKRGKTWLFAASALIGLIGAGATLSSSLPQLAQLTGRAAELIAPTVAHADAISDYNAASDVYATASGAYKTTSDAAAQAATSYHMASDAYATTLVGYNQAK